MQTRLGSFAEAWANIAIGFGINFAANLLVLPLFGFDVTPADAFGIGLVFTAISLARSYEREPRVTVDTTPAVFTYYRWGACLVGVHHGHSCKPDKLPGVMAADRSKDWGETKHRYWWMGHIHHESKKEYPGVSVESFNTLAPKDAYATAGGWRSRESMQAIVLHSEFGEVARSRVTPAMVAKVA